MFQKLKNKNHKIFIQEKYKHIQNPFHQKQSKKNNLFF